MYRADKFTGKQRDPESGGGNPYNGNDYFGARYYSSAMGRFLSPDWAFVPAPIPFANLSFPQTLNLYAYANNNPVTAEDPDGHYTGSFSESSGCLNEMSETDENGAPILNGPNCSSFNNPQYQKGAVEGGSRSDDLENRYQSILQSDSDPYGIAHDTTGYQFSGGDGSLFDRDKQYVALAVGQKIARGLPSDQVRDEIQFIYDNLTTSGEYTGGLHGGNFNFNPTIGSINITDYFHMGRNGIVPSVHIEKDRDTRIEFFHVDTANGASIAGPIHWVVDVLLGQTILQSGIPR